MAALQTADNAKQLNKQLKRMAAEHNREMKDIRALFKKMIERIAV